MNKLIPLIALALVILFGCDKEEMIPTIADSPKVDETSVWVINTNGDSPVSEFITLDEQLTIKSTLSSASTKSNNGKSVHAHGDFAGIVVFSGTENNGGVHGSATVTIGLGTYICETECVMVDGSEAVYGGTITEVAGPPPPPPGLGIPAFYPGDHIYFKVFDNGQGNNAPADQFHGIIRFASADDSKCGIWTPNSGAWPESLTFGNFVLDLIVDVEDPGSIKINN